MILTVLFLTDKNGYNNKKDFQSTKKKLSRKKIKTHFTHGILDFVFLKSKKGKIKTKKLSEKSKNGRQMEVNFC